MHTICTLVAHRSEAVQRRTLPILAATALPPPLVQKIVVLQLGDHCCPSTIFGDREYECLNYPAPPADDGSRINWLGIGVFLVLISLIVGVLAWMYVTGRCGCGGGRERGFALELTDYEEGEPEHEPASKHRDAAG